MMCQVNQSLEGVSERLSRFFSFSSKISQGREDEEKSESEEKRETAEIMSLGGGCRVVGSKRFGK